MEAQKPINIFDGSSILEEAGPKVGKLLCAAWQWSDLSGSALGSHLYALANILGGKDEPELSRSGMPPAPWPGRCHP